MAALKKLKWVGDKVDKRNPACAGVGRGVFREVEGFGAAVVTVKGVGGRSLRFAELRPSAEWKRLADAGGQKVGWSIHRRER
jgi:hypothetical protein